MPPKRKTTKRRVPRSRAATRSEMKGEGIMDIVKGINKFLKKNKVISKAAGVAQIVGVPHAGKVGKIAGVAGYGRGGALRMGGGALRPGGARRASGKGKKKGTMKPKKKY
mgnify:CR=1 FL=1